MNIVIPPKRHFNGFALVVTLSLMILLTVMAVGLLTLSTISLRSSSQGKALSEARANARMALMMAIGDLQKELGPDQRVSANGSILSDTPPQHPQWTGVWDSWRAGPTASSSDATSEHSTISNASNSGLAPSYETNRKGHFRSWLVSLTPDEARKVTSPIDLALGTNSVELVGKGTLGASGDIKNYVKARLIPVKPASSGPAGRYGWWVGDESQKVRIMEDTYESDPAQTLAQRLSRHQAPGSTGTTTVKGLEGLVDSSQLGGIPSLQTLNLLKGATSKPADNFHSITPFSRQVIADVREGGLKRDLSTLLEREINIGESGDDFMLYKFGTNTQQQVPIHDLAAFYQLYDNNRSSVNGGLRYSSNLISNGVQVVSPDYGDGNADVFARQYSTLYRQPMPIKVQFLLSLFAEPTGDTQPNANTHYLRIGITPSVTMWNPSNVPMVMNFNSADPQRNAQLLRLGMLPLRIKWSKNNGQYVSAPQHLTWFAYGGDGTKAHTFNLYFSGKKAVRFEPGEVKIFSLPVSGDVSDMKKGGDAHNSYYNKDFFFKTDKYYEGHEVVGGWEPRAFMLFNRSSPTSTPNSNVHVKNNKLAFKTGDIFSFEITADNPDLPKSDGYAGAPFYFSLIQSNHQSYKQYGGTEKWGFKHYVFGSRNGTGAGQVSFGQSLVTKGFPSGKTTISSGSRSGGNIIARSSSKEGWPFLQFSLQAGVETHEKSNGGLAGGRKFASRPFLHSSPLAAPFIDDFSGNALYNSGWNWSIDEINEVFEAPVQTNPKNPEQGYYGGGYTQEFGTSNLIQQEIPVAPPLSLAALSHARLGGFSVANESNPGNDTNQVVTATGQAGLFPHTLQAIGNAYAHPLLAANKAFDNYQRTITDPTARSVILADHSYLANKALWDDFFFSSITPQPSSVKAFGSTSRTAKEVAGDFFFKSKQLPNRRITPYKRNLDQARLDTLFTKASAFRGGLADEIAAHLMEDGPFNINSTSVEAWRGQLSSLKGKPVAYLDKSKALAGVMNPDQVTPAGTPVASFSLPNAGTVKRSADPQEPEQWLGWRELSDTEITELAEAIVRQVKLRGPFLSLSEFVNRRLDSGNPKFSVKGALQAALDDDKVSINGGFRNKVRQLGPEIGTMTPAFSEALEGPVAYGSAAYVDQADVLRNFGAQLTPRGDTFVIRTYGDSRDSSGKVLARAWCEAVVQRLPEYMDLADKPHVKQADLISAINKTFGRKLEIVTFRWLRAAEI